VAEIQALQLYKHNTRTTNKVFAANLQFSPVGKVPAGPTRGRGRYVAEKQAKKQNRRDHSSPPCSTRVARHSAAATARCCEPSQGALDRARAARASARRPESALYPHSKMATILGIWGFNIGSAAARRALSAERPIFRR